MYQMNACNQHRQNESKSKENEYCNTHKARHMESHLFFYCVTKCNHNFPNAIKMASKNVEHRSRVSMENVMLDRREDVIASLCTCMVFVWYTPNVNRRGLEFFEISKDNAFYVIGSFHLLQ